MIDDDSFEDDGATQDIGDLLPFMVGEKDLIDQLAGTIRASLQTLEPAELRQIAVFLFALERLPYASVGVSIDLAITHRIEESFSYVSVEISGDAFRLSTGGSVYSPGVGSDSYSEIRFEIETGGYREGTTEAFAEWLDMFRATHGSYSIENFGDDDIDLTEEAPADGWDRLAAYWDSHGGDEYGY